MEKVNELYKKNDEAITNSAKEMVKAFKSKAEQASNPFTHDGATYKDNDTKGGHTWAYTDMEKEIVFYNLNNNDLESRELETILDVDGRVEITIEEIEDD